MVEVIVSVVAKVAEYLVAPIGRQFCYLCNYNNHLENLQREVEKLIDARERVKHSVDDAKRKGEEIEDDVEKWLVNVNKIVDKAEKFIEDEEKAKKNRCFKGLCPNLKSRYQLSKKAVREAKVVIGLQEKGKFGRVSYCTVAEAIWLTADKGYEAFESRMASLKKIVNALSRPDIYMIGVYGMGGIGKTMLVKEVARQVKMHKLFDEVVFAEVSQTPDIKRIQGEIADELGLELNVESESGRASKLYARLKNEKKILVILDNVWDGLDLDRIGIPFGDDNKGCKVLLTSRDLDVLSNKMDTQDNFLVGVLNEKEAWSLFKTVAGDHFENRNSKSIATDIVKECAGLPIAIVSLGRALRNKSLFEWKNALLTLRRPSSATFTGMHAVAYSTIELSYNHLEDEELKSTFLLCSLMGYTENGSMLHLLNYGIGLSLFKGIVTMEEARNRVSTLVRKLKSSSLLLDSYSGEMFAMHDVVRDVAISIASREWNVFTMRNQVVPWEWLDKNSQKNCTVVSLHKTYSDEIPEELECPQLKLFYMFNNDPSLKIPDNFFAGMPELKVLDLANVHLVSLPSSLHLLVNLRTLCLDLSVLGDIAIIGELKKLEVLSFWYSKIEQLPREIGQLTWLRLLDLSNCCNLKVIPPNVISSLFRLEELYMGNSFFQWEVEGFNMERKNASLNELKHLSHLTTLEVQIQDAKIIPRDLFPKNLERYKIFIGDEWDWDGDHGTSKTLRLKLITRICLEDGIIMQMKGVEELYLDELQDVKNVAYELDSEGFPQLKYLYVQNNPYFLCIVGSVDCVACDAFPLLESLSLRRLINLEKICHGHLSGESFSRLRIIKVGNCDKLKSILSLSIARGLQQLQIIEVTECRIMEEIFSIGTEDNINNNEGYKMEVTDEDVTEEEIIFGKLKRLSLSYLPNLSSLCSGNGTFKFPSLEEVIVKGCPNMKIFSPGVLSTPSLHKVKVSLAEGEVEACWEGDINTTIQELHKI
ncbi:probable disease resistance protein At4g27220 [Pistacia vera]|uniref:probable disease resistance protein At4g27220 n=1 Tax=Pistacia vera TaxID=55513 RepID=UPI0012638936|nr:probable disease resistance protein At4g27220 [Pistacia vera]